MQREGAHTPFVRAARAHPLVVALVVLAAAATSIALLKARTAEYEATAQILVTPTSNDGVFAGLPVVTNSSADPARTLQTATTILQSPAAAAAAARTLRGGWTAASVGRAVDVQPQGESDIVAVTGKASDGPTARRVASADPAAAMASSDTDTAIAAAGAALAQGAEADGAGRREGTPQDRQDEQVPQLPPAGTKFDDSLNPEPVGVSMKSTVMG